jgi:hypothetical protein
MNDLPHGEGSFVSSRGDTYTGGWINGEMHGHGRLVHECGECVQCV